MLLISAGLGLLTVGTAASSIKDMIEGSSTKNDRNNLKNKNDGEREEMLKRVNEIDTKNKSLLKEYSYVWRYIDMALKNTGDYNKGKFIMELRNREDKMPLIVTGFKKFNIDEFERKNGIRRTNEGVSIISNRNINNNVESDSKVGTVAMATTAAAGTVIANNALNGAATFLNASTGTPIKVLSGASKMNATNAAFGGGAIAAGGMGKVVGGAIKGGASVAAGAKLRTSAYKKINQMNLEEENKKRNFLIKAMDELKKLEKIVSRIHIVSEKSIEKLKMLRKKIDECKKEDGKIPEMELNRFKKELKNIEELDVLLAMNHIANRCLVIKGYANAK